MYPSDRPFFDVVFVTCVPAYCVVLRWPDAKNIALARIVGPNLNKRTILPEHISDY